MYMCVARKKKFNKETFYPIVVFYKINFFSRFVRDLKKIFSTVVGLLAAIILLLIFEIEKIFSATLGLTPTAFTLHLIYDGRPSVIYFSP